MMDPLRYRRAGDGKCFVVEAEGDLAEMLTDAEKADCDSPEWDEEWNPTQRWEDLSGLLHCGNCAAVARSLYGKRSLCAVCFNLDQSGE